MTEPAKVLLTTAPAVEGHSVQRVLDVVSAECVFGMNLFRDFFAGLRDIFGGRSEAAQNVLRDARRACLHELRLEAALLGANAVIGVDLDYSEFSGQGKSMLFLVASGTAVILDPTPDAPASPLSKRGRAIRMVELAEEDLDEPMVKIPRGKPPSKGGAHERDWSPY
jgi:uncharacterized protein YbjQ (UPF0145 family)